MLLYVLAVAAHLPFLTTPMYGDEAVQYTMARHWGSWESHGAELTTDERVPYGLLFWQRFAFPVLLSPGAAFGFDAMRFEFILITSLLAPLGYEALRRSGTRTGWAGWAIGAGIAVATHPILTLWGTRVFPDAMAATFLLGGLVALLHRRTWLAAILLVVSAWSKEVVLPAILGIFLLALLRALLDRRDLRRPDWNTVGWLAVATLLAPLPLWYVLTQGARPPGWTFVGDYQAARLFIGFWSLPLLAYLLLRRPLQEIPWLALGFPTLFIVDHAVRNVTIEEWYLVLPNLFVLLGVFAALDLILSPLIAVLRAPHRHTWRFPMTASTVFAIVALLLATTNVAGVAPDKEPRAASTYWDVLEVAHHDGQDLPPTVERVRLEDPQRLVLVDVGWYYLEYPWADLTHSIRYLFTGHGTVETFPFDRLDQEMRRSGTLTVIHRSDPPTPIVEEIEDRYGSCKIYDLPTYVVIRATDCPQESSFMPLVPLP